MNKRFFHLFQMLMMHKAFAAPVLIFISTFTACNNEVKLKGIVIDDINHLPVFNAQVKTITGVTGRTLEFAEARTNKAGVFEIVFNSNQVTAEKLSVEISKANYLSNVYDVWQHSFDTIVLIRSIRNEFEFFEKSNNQQ